jgi:hypothetical protein
MSKFSIEIKWGVIFSAASIAWMIVEKSLGYHDNHIGLEPLFSNIFGIFAFAIFFFGILEEKKRIYKNNMTWTQGFISGVYLAFFCTAFCPVAQYIVYTFVSPDFFKNMVNYRVLHHEQTREKAEAVFNLGSYIAQAVSFTMSMGVLTAAIVALLLRTKDKARS